MRSSLVLLACLGLCVALTQARKLKTSECPDEGGATCPTMQSFFEENPVYSIYAEAVPELLDPSTCVTLFLPMPKNGSWSEPAPNLSQEDIDRIIPLVKVSILPKAYKTAAELASVGCSPTYTDTNLKLSSENGDITISIKDKGVVAKVIPVPIIVGESAIYLMNVENADTNEAEIPGLELFVWGLLANVGIGLLSSWLG